MRSILNVLMLASTALAADKPNVPTRVATLEQEVASLQSKLTGMDSKYRQAIEVATKAAKATDAYQRALSDVSDKESTLNHARESGSPQDRLDASSAFNKAREAAAAIISKAVEGSPDVRRTRSAKTEFSKKLLQAKTELADEQESERIKEKDKADKESERIKAGKPSPERVAEILTPLHDELVRIRASTQPSSQPIANDPYESYRKNAMAVLASLEILQKGTDGPLSEAPERSAAYLQIFKECSEFFNVWKSSLSVREVEYPSVSKISQAIEMYRKVGVDFVFYCVFKHDAATEEAAKDLDGQVASLDEAIKTASHMYDSAREGQNLISSARRLLKSREGTESLLPPPPPNHREDHPVNQPAKS